MNTSVATLVAKYDVPGPRYTSYPTVPYWETTPTQEQWLAHVRAALASTEARAYGASIYVHVPFCRALCTFCGCNTRITRTHTIINPYIQSVLGEYALYRRGIGVEKLELGELHLGGGTPTFLTVEELDQLLGGILGAATLRGDAVLGVEVDPRVTTCEQLELMARHGFNRVSLGVQDFDPKVQAIVNRVQSEAQVRSVTEYARAFGYRSVNYDLIYGLPFQTLDSIEQTMDAVCRLRPDRIALYGYAHVPWIKPGQRRFTELDLPEGEAKRALYERSRERLEKDGYREIGLDHFALESDELWRSAQAGTLHRNFMGYTPLFTQPLLGLGASAIGDSGDAFAQNEKELQPYQARVARGELPIQRGHVLDAEDAVLRRHILRLMTQMRTRWDGADYTPYLDAVPAKLAEFAADGLVRLEPHGCEVTGSGRAFLRNICMAFDARLARKLPDKTLFSRTA
ncbi:MAG: oxygen-independent coproporphyrinogen III oxidase [Gammaproteobacteria bacterium]|nr:oxygen-independent coproporphyrinogen III oxidase [Gammaproteobacteria bacterium]